MTWATMNEGQKNESGRHLRTWARNVALVAFLAFVVYGAAHPLLLDKLGKSGSAIFMLALGGFLVIGTFLGTRNGLIAKSSFSTQLKLVASGVFLLVGAFGMLLGWW